MHFSLWERIGGALLISAWLVYGSMNIGNVLVHVREHESTMASEGAPAAKGATAVAQVDFATALNEATPAEGEKVFGKCKSCHTIDKGGANKVGPNLWNVAGGPKAHMQGFAYSAGMQSKGGTWGYDELDTFLTKPAAYIAGTKMSFAGLGDTKDRAAIVRYLAANSENPPPLPAPAPKTAASEPAAPAPALAATPPGDASAAAPEVDFKTLLSAADPAAGEKVFGKCKACHNAEKGGANQVGPNLWGVVGRPVAHHEGFNYSPALAGKNGETWSYEQLNIYLTSPKAWAPGTKMTFAGLAKPEERANVIIFLRSRSDSPPPLP